MEEKVLNQEEVKEVEELNDQFVEFLHTKGIKAKFKLAFANMKESTKAQHEKDVANFNAVKAKSIEENKEFYEFLHTKGFKAKVKLVIENIKKGAKEVKNRPIPTQSKISEANLNKELELFLKSKGLWFSSSSINIPLITKSALVKYSKSLAVSDCALS